MLGIPHEIHACLFDPDGVLTRTAKVHAAAWKEMFDGYLRERAKRTGTPFVPFDPVADYEKYADGKPRADGVRSFLASRAVALPEGSPDDPPGAEAVNGLANRKNEILLEMIRRDGYVIGVDRLGQAAALRARGADIVVNDLAELLDKP